MVGAALGEAGLKRSTPLAMPALVIGANLPDVDVAAHAWGGLAALEFRRGWTHGILALAVLPLVLVGLLLLWDRLVDDDSVALKGPPTRERSCCWRTPRC